MELLFEQEVTGKTTRLILEIEQRLDQFALQMINHNEIVCLVPLEAVWYNNANYLQYDITGMTPLSSRLSAVLKKSEVMQLLGSMISGFEETDAYMLCGNNLYLNLDYIFVDGEDKCVFLYLPFELDEGMDQISFLQQVTECLLPNYEEKDPYLFHILNAFHRGAVKQLADLKEILRKNSVEEDPLAGMAGKAAEGRMPEERQPEQNLAGAEKKALNEKPQLNIKLPLHDKQKTSGKSPAVEIPHPQAPGGQNSERSRAAEALGASFAIPGKREGIPVNIPGKSESFSAGIPEKKKGEKKKNGIHLFGKKEKESAQGAKAAISAPPVEEKIRTGQDADMYESYAQTVMMVSPGQEKAADSNATICLGIQKIKAELVREKTGERLQIMPEGTILGSGSAASCQISGNKAISRSHATIQMQDGVCYITDNNSSNGTWVNDSRLIPGNPKEIVNDTRIKLANEDFIFKIQ